jgi:cobalt/nickel transport system permease protein
MVDVALFGAVNVHMIGAAFLVLLAGPALALLGMAVVVTFQALALNDGGVTTLGANVLNMAVVGVATAALAKHMVCAHVPGRNGLFAAAFLASAVSAMAAVLAMTTELALSGTPFLSAFKLTVPAHAPFAAWEALCTLVLAIAAVCVRAIHPLAAAPTSK